MFSLAPPINPGYAVGIGVIPDARNDTRMREKFQRVQISNDAQLQYSKQPQLGLENLIRAEVHRI